eukprot:5693314-Pyramimonas_sp.AAC.1
MRLPHPAQRFVAPYGAPPKVAKAVSTCVSPTQYSASWLNRELHRRRYPQLWYSQLHMVGPFARLICVCIYLIPEKSPIIFFRDLGLWGYKAIGLEGYGATGLQGYRAIWL